MVYCCIPQCTNHSAKTSRAGTVVSYHKIPRNLQLQRAWIARLRTRRTNLPQLKNCYVCSEHFEKDDFDTGPELQRQLLGKRSRRCLKADAVPTKFPSSTSGSVPQTRGRPASDRRMKRQEHEEVRLQVLRLD